MIKWMHRQRRREEGIEVAAVLGVFACVNALGGRSLANVVASQKGGNLSEDAVVALAFESFALDRRQETVELVEAKEGAIAVVKNGIDMAQIVGQGELEWHRVHHTVVGRRAHSSRGCILVNAKHGEGKLVKGACIFENVRMQSTLNALVANGSHIVQNGSQEHSKAGQVGRDGFAFHHVHVAVQLEAIFRRNSFARVKRINDLVQRDFIEVQRAAAIGLALAMLLLSL